MSRQAIRKRPKARRQTRAMRRFIIAGVMEVEAVVVVEVLVPSRTARRGRTAIIWFCGGFWVRDRVSMSVGDLGVS